MIKQDAPTTTGPAAEASKLAWVDDIERVTLDNNNFRTVVYTGSHAQLAVMRLGPGEEIGWESHPHLDQFLRIEQGQARLHLGRTGDAADEQHDLTDDWAIVVPAGIWHNVVNTGDGEVKLYSLYSPPEHPDGAIHRTCEMEH